MAQDPINNRKLVTPAIQVGVEQDLPTNQPAGTSFTPTEYNLLRSEQTLAPNFQVDRGLGQGTNNVDYTAATPQPDFTAVQSGGIGGDRAISYGEPIGPDLRTDNFGNQVPGNNAVAYTGPVAPEFGAGETRGTGTIGGDAAITEGQQIGPDFSNPTGTGPTTPGGGGWSPEEVQVARQNTPTIGQRALTEDWRFRIGLMPGSEVLYKDGDTSSLLSPLLATDGVIFPYTPNVMVNHRANYDKISPVHSNYPTYFYQSSEISDVQVNATFTAQSVDEADYMMAMIHFFRSATKMFYGQDENRGTPPPLLALTGFGQHQFNFHKAVLTQFNYALPDGVDYIRTSAGGVGSIQAQATRGQLQGGGGNFGIFGIASRIGRLFGIGATPGAETGFQTANEGTNLARAGASYVPTKIEISLTLLPVVTRAEQSKQFSLRDYATGKGLSQRGQW